MKELPIYIPEHDYDRVIAALSAAYIGEPGESSEELAAAAIMVYVNRVSKDYDQTQYNKEFVHSPPDVLVPVDWVQPDGTGGYKRGAVVRYDSEIWISSVDNNVWVPGESGWHRYGEDPDDGPFPWVQPTGAHDAYPVGAQVTHNGQTWESEVANNTWEPGVYGWVAI